LNTSSKPKVISYENAMVAVCDILGFKVILNSLPLEDIVEDDFAYLRKALYSSLHQDKTPEHTPTLEDFQAQNRVGFAWFSDTVLLYSLEDNVNGYINLIETAAWLIIQTIVGATLRYRIGISYGKVYIDPENQIYLGKAIAEANELQSKQEWSGGALTRQAEAKIPQGIKEADFPPPWHLAQYRVPLKMPKSMAIVVDKDNRPLDNKAIITSELMLAVDWTRFLHTEFHLRWSREREEPQSDEAPADVIMKWYQTREFHKNVCKFCSKQGAANYKNDKQ
jgi:hypothetical protein